MGITIEPTFLELLSGLYELAYVQGLVWSKHYYLLTIFIIIFMCSPSTSYKYTVLI